MKLKRSYLILGAVLDNLGAEVRALYGAKVLLVTLGVAGVLVEHVRGPRLDLRLDDSVPQCLRLDLFLEFTLLFVPKIIRQIDKN